LKTKTVTTTNYNVWFTELKPFS